jgi:hypothetical protein
MDADGEWAPPVAKNARMLDPDLELARRFSRVPAARGRALLLGLDWDAIRAARRRLLIGAWTISGTLALAILVPAFVLQVSNAQRDGLTDLRYAILSVTLGGICAYFARLLSGAITRRIVRDPEKHGTWEQHRMVEPAIEALWFAGLTGAVLLFSFGRFEQLGLVGCSALAAMISLRSVSRLPVLIQRAYVTTVPTFLDFAKRAPGESLLGYRVKWLVLDHLAVTVCAVSLPLVTLEYWWLIIPAALVLAVFGTVAARASLNGHPRLSVSVRLVAAAMLSSAAAQFILSADGLRFFA